MEFLPRASALVRDLHAPRGALVLLLPPFKRNDEAVRWVANGFGVLGFLVSLPLWLWFDPARADAAGFQFVERRPGSLDRGAVPARRRRHQRPPDPAHDAGSGPSRSLLVDRDHAAGAAVLRLPPPPPGRDAGRVRLPRHVLFYVFWEVMLVPMYFLIGIWGAENRLYAAIKFFLYTLVGSVVMLLGILALYFHSRRVLPGLEATGTFDLTAWLTMGIPADFHSGCSLAFFLGFAIKSRCSPFHTWLPDAHVQAPTAGSVILAGVLLKMGTYGFVRFSLPSWPDATREAVPWVVTLAIVSIVYAALVTLVQKDMKKLIAYSSVSHLGFVMLGMSPSTHWASRAACYDGQPRPLDGRAVPRRGAHLRAEAHQGDRGLRRAGPRNARLRHVHASSSSWLDGLPCSTASSASS